MVRRTVGLLAVVLLASVTGIASSFGGAAAATSRRPLLDSTFNWTRHTAAVGSPSPHGAVSLRVYLASRDPAGLLTTLQAVTTPGNASYRHFLTPAQYSQRFAPSNTEVAQVRAWLQSAGLKVTGVAA